LHKWSLMHEGPERWETSRRSVPGGRGTSELPPVNAFWSLTLYDAEGFQVANELNRFAIGDRDDLASNDDGSLDIFIQHDKPEQGSSNWLPAPTGEFTLCARLYYPKPEVLNGTWAPQAVRRVN
jgi:hypothetical protein